MLYSNERTKMWTKWAGKPHHHFKASISLCKFRQLIRILIAKQLWERMNATAFTLLRIISASCLFRFYDPIKTLHALSQVEENFLAKKWCSNTNVPCTIVCTHLATTTLIIETIVFLLRNHHFLNGRNTCVNCI